MRNVHSTTGLANSSIHEPEIGSTNKLPNKVGKKTLKYSNIMNAARLTFFLSDFQEPTLLPLLSTIV
jgi:hypothetical protein